MVSFHLFDCLLHKITIKNPEKTKILIYDFGGSDILVETILHGFNYSIFPARQELFFFSPQILFRMLKKISLSEVIRMKNKTGHIYKIYIISCIEHINPKIIITFVDTDPTFHWLSKTYDNAQFYAIQNGVRNKYNLYTTLLNPDGTVRKITLPTFICFGQNDVDNFTKFGHEIDNSICLGSLRGGYYKFGLNRTAKEIQFDICLVSEYSIELTKDISMNDFFEAYQKLITLLKEYILKNKKTICIALRSSTNDEYEYYSKIFGNDVTIIRQHKNDFFSTYNAMDMSEVLLTLRSTAAFEAFGWGKKVLFCNFLTDEISDFYNSGICHIEDGSFQAFEERLNYLLNISQHEFMKITQSQRKYMMNYNSDLPVHIYMKNLITDLLDN